MYTGTPAHCRSCLEHAHDGDLRQLAHPKAGPILSILQRDFTPLFAPGTTGLELSHWIAQRYLLAMAAGK